MKIKKVITEAVIQEIEVQIPCYRKRYDDNLAYIHDGGHVVINTSINSIYKTPGRGDEFFDDRSEECTHEEFMEAFEKVESAVRAIKIDVKLPF